MVKQSFKQFIAGGLNKASEEIGYRVGKTARGVVDLAKTALSPQAPQKLRQAVKKEMEYAKTPAGQKKYTDLAVKVGSSMGGHLQDVSLDKLNELNSSLLKGAMPGKIRRYVKTSFEEVRERWNRGDAEGFKNLLSQLFDKIGMFYQNFPDDKVNDILKILK